MSFVRLHALRRPLGFALLGLCGLGQKPFLSAAGGALPLDELSALHQKFGGDASVWANQPMPQRARSGGTISALSVQIPALERLAPYLRPGASVFDLGFGSGVMTAMLLAAAPSSGVRVIGVDLEDKVKVATENMLKTSGPFRFQREQFEFLGGDAFHYLQRWKDEGKTFDVVYSGCSFDPDTQQLALFLGRLKPTGAAVFNLGNPGKQGMYFVADGGKKCELLMRVNFMMAESPLTPPASDSVPLDPSRLGQWIQQNIFTDKEGVDYETLSQHSDATRDIGVAAQRQHGAALARVGSWHGRSTADVRASDIAQPGGFRRFFFGDAGARPLMEDVMRVQQSETFEVRLASPLLPFYVGKEGIAEQYHLVLMILKGFAGAAVLYLPRSFLNGGLVLGMVTLAAVCFLFTVSMKKLIDCAETVQVKRMTETSMRQQQYMEHGLSKLTVPSYGDMGEEAFGRLGRVLVELSICVSQLGFCSTYFVFVSANVSEVLGTLAGCQHVMSQRSLCLLLAMLWTPLALIRSLKHFSTLNLLADACILLGLIVILAAAVPRLHDVIPWEVPLMKMDSYPLCLGTAAFAFEGIGLVLPMYEGTHPKMRKEFKGTMSWTLAGLCSFFILFASVAYVSFGPTTRTVILFNLHMGGLKRLTSQVLFCMALICTYPLMLHPVSKLIEDRLRGGKTSSMLGEVFAASEAFRVSLVVLTMMVAISCASRLESLVAIVGGLACAPLALVFPPALHHMLVGGQPLQDFILALLGVLLATVSSTQAAMHWRVHQEIPYFSCSGS